MAIAPNGLFAPIVAPMLLRRIGLRPWWLLMCAGLVCGVLAVSVPWVAAPAYAVFGAGATLAAGVDGAERRLPDRLTVPLALVCPVLLAGSAWVLGQPGRALRMVLGAGALGVVYLALHLANPAGLGFGDVKLSISIGAVLAWASWDAWWAGALLGPLLGAWAGLVLLRRARAERPGPRASPPVLPFGPPMIAGAIAGLAVVGVA